jgi:sugar lactone lactonase YvrE
MGSRHILRSVVLLIISSAAGLASQSGVLENGDRGPAIRAVLNQPTALALDKTDNLYIVETVGRRVRMVDASTGIITTVAGNGKGCCLEEDRAATSVALHYPFAVAVDEEKNIFVADSIARVYRVDSKTGLITTLLRQTGGSRPDPRDEAHLPDREQISGLAVDPNKVRGPLYVLSHTAQIYSVSGDSISTFFGERQGTYDRDITQLHSPSSIAVNASGDLFLADRGKCRLFRIDSASKSLSTFAGTGQCKPAKKEGDTAETPLANPVGIAVDGQGNVYFSESSPFCLGRIDSQTRLLAALPGACEIPEQAKWVTSGLAVDRKGNVFFTIWGSNVVRRLDVKTHAITTVAGTESSPPRIGPRH